MDKYQGIEQDIVAEFKKGGDRHVARIMKDDLEEMGGIEAVGRWWHAIAAREAIACPFLDDVSHPARDTVDLLFRWSPVEPTEEDLEAAWAELMQRIDAEPSEELIFLEA